MSSHYSIEKTVQQSGKAFATDTSEKGFISLITKEIKRNL